MKPNRARTGSVWLKARKQKVEEGSEWLEDFQMLRKEAKKIEIMARIDKRTKTNESAWTVQRPRSTNPHGRKQESLSFKQVEHLYKREKSLTSNVLTETQGVR